MMNKISKLAASLLIAGTAVLGASTAQAFWGPFDWFDDDDDWYGPGYGYGGYPGYGGWGGPGYGYGGYPGYGGWGGPGYGYGGYPGYGGYSGYGYGGYPGYGYGGHPGYGGWGYPATVAPAAPPATPAK
jgi:hypothetical protein